MTLFGLGNGTVGSPDNSCCKPYIQKWNWCKCCGQDHFCGLQYLCVPDFKKCYGNQESPSILPTSHKNASETQEKNFWCYLKKKPSCCPQASFDRLKNLQELCGKSPGRDHVTNECTIQDQDPCRKE